MNKRASAFHEEFGRDYAVAGASNRRFGFVIGGILLLIAALRTFLHGEANWFDDILFAAGFVLALAALIKPELLAPVNRGWARLGLLLHKVTNPIFLGAMYLIAIVPTGLLMRLFGADPMGRKRKPEGGYWIAREKRSSTAQSLTKPF